MILGVLFSLVFTAVTISLVSSKIPERITHNLAQHIHLSSISEIDMIDSTLIRRKISTEVEVVHDIFGTASSSLNCNKTFYPKREVYAAANKACSLLQATGQKKNKKCWFKNCKNTFPRPVQDNPNLHLHPILPNGELYESGKPGQDMIIIDRECRVIDVITKKNGLYQSCPLASPKPLSQVLNNVI
ncbi:hypothetical protein K3495_g7709 [Podosphaera aphanis]|nr:hypothetical protein K3495_g7709 [Podosphaera aphanis]